LDFCPGKVLTVILCEAYSFRIDEYLTNENDKAAISSTTAALATQSLADLMPECLPTLPNRLFGATLAIRFQTALRLFSIASRSMDEALQPIERDLKISAFSGDWLIHESTQRDSSEEQLPDKYLAINE
jgi:hypothetical protein